MYRRKATSEKALKIRLFQFETASKDGIRLRGKNYVASPGKRGLKATNQ
jgi:hypothetical protein